MRRVGATRTVAVDVRVVAATHRDLKDEVEAGRFRGDLYYRLNVFPIELPPLRQRRSDIPLLAAHFLERVAREHRREIRGFDPEALAALTGYGWPGNVRELENAVERAVAVTDGPVIPVTALPAETRTTAVDGASFAVRLDQTFREAVDAARVQVSRDYLVRLMKDFGGNVTRATERAGVERESLHRLLRRFNVRPDDFRTD